MPIFLSVSLGHLHSTMISHQLEVAKNVSSPKNGSLEGSVLSEAQPYFAEVLLRA